MTFQALLKVLLPQLMVYLDRNNMELKQKIIEAERENDDLGLVTVLTKTEFHETLKKLFVHTNDLMQTMVCCSATLTWKAFY